MDDNLILAEKEARKLRSALLRGQKRESKRKGYELGIDLGTRVGFSIGLFTIFILELLMDIPIAVMAIVTIYAFLHSLYHTYQAHEEILEIKKED